MLTTFTQDREFISYIIGSDLLENSIEWISKNMNPDDVFSTSELESWAESNGYAKIED